MPSRLPSILARLDDAMRAGQAAQATLQLTLARSEAARVEQAEARLEQELARSRVLMERTLRVTLAEGLRPVAEELLDGMMAIVAAQRGFVGLSEGAGWQLLTGRGLHKADLVDPAAQVSTSIITRCLQERAPVIAEDAAQELQAASVHALRLRSVACLPLLHEGALLGFVYLDDPGARGLFDAAALSALQAWLPLVAACLHRAQAPGAVEGLPGVLTRSPRLLAELAELRRVAVHDASILLTGETGTGKSLIARSVHAASPRAQGPFVHVNCGAIPEALVEGELLGAEAGAYTGAKARRIGKFEAASGGTLFLDELDSLPPSAQVKLLVALQERQVTRLGSNTPVPVDVRVIAAMGPSPAEAIAAGRLREDLYYRLAVYETRLPPLRERPEDIPLLAGHVLERARQRYGLPPLRLSPRAEAQLLERAWPGNVRELENALDRAALLARGGYVEALAEPRAVAPLAHPEASPGGVVALLQRAGERLAEEMLRREDLADLKLVAGWKGALLQALVQRLGSREAAFELLGMHEQVRSNNHYRVLRRELARLSALAEALGEPPP
ncbi:MAG: sigma 54-interacting transcriptional regulator [Alphaproteobacteria bacterium]|nr:sigma 54-interacting transcriptional regulator [Alphaproteobacteria bacterium]MCB9792212.1 sigma 54-interacting transcriptional regulator [Alphaproteobacteria bacterium]